MTPEEIRARLYAAQGDMSAVAADCMLNSTDPLEGYSTVAANARADRLLAAHLEITKPMREAADELEKALEKALYHEGGVYEWGGIRNEGRTALARYRAVKGETP